MNDLKKLKKHYDKKGWVVCRKLFSQRDKSSNKLIDDFLKNEISSIKKETRAINFVDKKKVLKILIHFMNWQIAKKLEILQKKKGIRCS